MTLALAVLLQSCGLPSRYSVTLENETAVRLDDVQVTWTEYVVSAGIVSPGTGKIEAFPDASFPERAVVQWRSPDGFLHEVEVDVAAAVGRKSRWANVELVFSIGDTETVVVRLDPGLD
jgi:hypothetical protein